MEHKKILVIGGGFAGLNFIKHINRKKYNVTVVDSNNYHSFPPLFYQLASAGLDAASINFPLRREMHTHHARGCHYRLGRVHRIDTVNKKVYTQYETLDYDILVIAAGTTNNFFGIENLHKFVYTLKSTPEAIRCRNDILDRLERATLEKNPEKRKELLTFVIIGGGPTGVEIAGAMGDLKKYIIPREYPDISPNEIRVTLVEGTDRLLQAMSMKSSIRVKKYLEKLQVDVMLNKTLKSYGEDNIVHFADGSTLNSSMVIWTAGVTGASFTIDGATGHTIGKGNRLVVDDYNRVQDLKDVYALGDIALNISDKYPHGHPQVAQVAIQSGKNLAVNLNEEKPKRPFIYKDKGSMATVGRNLAVVDIKNINIGGRMAWIMWMAVHLMSLLGMRNKITVFVTWIWAYFTYSSSTRLLLKVTRWPRRMY